jgi:hypothetical protein
LDLLVGHRLQLFLGEMSNCLFHSVLNVQFDLSSKGLLLWSIVVVESFVKLAAGSFKEMTVVINDISMASQLNILAEKLFIG